MDSSKEVKSYNFALLTLKERCHFLKEQLKVVDEENIKLKMQLVNSKPVKPETVNGQESLMERIEVLNKQKSQLSNQVHILATENSNMWLRLSKLSMINRTLNRRLAHTTETLDKNGLPSTFSDHDLESSVPTDSKEYRKSIEEMSLKLVSGIKLEKTELERQYAQMVALHNSDLYNSCLDLGFTSVDGEDDNPLGRLRKHAYKMNILKQKLNQQQSVLIRALEELKNAKEQNKKICFAKTSVREVSTETDYIQPRDISIVKSTIKVNANEIDITNSESDQVCPLCGVHVAGTMAVFCDHVASHMGDEPSSLAIS